MQTTRKSGRISGGKIEMRVLFLCAVQDIRPAWPVEQLYHFIPNGELAVVHNAGHYLWLQQYHEVKKHLRRFLNLSDEPEGELA